jgi:hypothetical protein
VPLLSVGDPRAMLVMRSSRKAMALPRAPSHDARTQLPVLRVILPAGARQFCEDHAGRWFTRPPNKELKLTKPSQDGASQLNSVFGGLVRSAREPRHALSS